jgi:hypothetical protein
VKFKKTPDAIYGYHVGTAGILQSLEDSGNVSQYTRISPKSTSVFDNQHKIPQNVKILTFDLKMAQKVQNTKNSIKNSFHKAFIPFVFYKTRASRLVL